MQRGYDVPGNHEKDRRRKKIQEDRNHYHGKKHEKNKQSRRGYIDHEKEFDFGWD